MPCLAKKYEAARPEFSRGDNYDTDYVISTRDEKVGWGIFSSVTAFVPILIYSGFPDFFSKGARNL